MALTVKDILATTYVLLDNASEEELDYIVALEQFGSVFSKMQFERILGNVGEIVTKGTLTFSDTTGIVTNNLTNFGDVIYLEFNSQPIDECPVALLDLYKDAGIQRAAFFKADSFTGTKKVQLSIPQSGELKVWYEPDAAFGQLQTSAVNIQDSLRWCLATRLAEACIPHLKRTDPRKIAALPVLAMSLSRQAEDWRRIYLEQVNKIGTDRPFPRLPFIAGQTNA